MFWIQNAPSLSQRWGSDYQRTWSVLQVTIGFRWLHQSYCSGCWGFKLQFYMCLWVISFDHLIYLSNHPTSICCSGHSDDQFEGKTSHSLTKSTRVWFLLDQLVDCYFSGIKVISTRNEPINLPRINNNNTNFVYIIIIIIFIIYYTIHTCV